MRETFYPVTATDGFPLVLTELSLARTRSKAPGFVFLHGLAQNRSAIIGALAASLIDRGARVFAAELRGHGLSQPSSADWRWGLGTHLRADLPPLLKRAAELTEHDRVHVLGHSMGGILGYAHLADPQFMRSLVTLGAPVVLGAGKPLLKSAAQLLGPLVGWFGPNNLPIDALLRLATFFAIAPIEPGIRGALSNLVRLGNPAAADPKRLREILSQGDPSSKQVFLELLTIARSGRAVIDGVDLIDTLSRSTLPVMAVIGGRDIFAPRESVEPILRGPGPRKILELPEAGHVDLTMGHRSEEIAGAVWRFTLDSAPSDT